MNDVAFGEVPGLLREILERLGGVENRLENIEADVATIKADVATIKAVLPVEQEAQNITTVRRAAGRRGRAAMPIAAKGGQ